MMDKGRRQFGFSLIEALLATGILGIGLVLIAMVFPVGIKLSATAADRTVGAIATDEAFAKIRLYGLPPVLDWPVTDPEEFPHIESIDYLVLKNIHNDGIDGWPKYHRVVDGPEDVWDEFFYPSSAVPLDQTRNVYWSALCRAVGPTAVQVTVFVTRKIGEASQYYAWDPESYTAADEADWPSPVPVFVELGDTGRELVVQMAEWPQDVFGFFSDNSVIVAGHNGRIYRVREVKTGQSGDRDTLVLDNAWEPSEDATEPDVVWVVPPSVNGSRNPVIDIAQRTLIFSE